MGSFLTAHQHTANNSVPQLC